MSEHLSYPDNFLHICVVPRVENEDWSTHKQLVFSEHLISPRTISATHMLLLGKTEHISKTEGLSEHLISPDSIHQACVASLEDRAYFQGWRVEWILDLPRQYPPGMCHFLGRQSILPRLNGWVNTWSVEAVSTMPALFLGRMLRMDHASEIQGLSEHLLCLDKPYHACVVSWKDGKDRLYFSESKVEWIPQNIVPTGWLNIFLFIIFGFVCHWADIHLKLKMYVPS